jgi:hypothetical protein
MLHASSPQTSPSSSPPRLSLATRQRQLAAEQRSLVTAFDALSAGQQAIFVDPAILHHYQADVPFTLHVLPFRARIALGVQPSVCFELARAIDTGKPAHWLQPRAPELLSLARLLMAMACNPNGASCAPLTKATCRQIANPGFAACSRVVRLCAPNDTVRPAARRLQALVKRFAEPRRHKTKAESLLATTLTQPMGSLLLGLAAGAAFGVLPTECRAALTVPDFTFVIVEPSEMLCRG